MQCSKSDKRGCLVVELTKAWQVDGQCYKACQPGSKQALLTFKQAFGQVAWGKPNDQLSGYLYSDQVALSSIPIS